MSLDKKIIKIIEENIENYVDVSPDSDLVEDLGADSFSILMIINALEEEFNILINEDDFKDIKTVLNIIEKIQVNYPQALGV